jgi:hypothetical protein
MSDIPDWLMELAAQQEDDDEDSGPAQAPEPAEPSWESREIGSAGTRPRPEERAAVSESDASGDDDASLDMMSALRNQVEIDQEEEAASEQRARDSRFRIPGLVPWQQFVLSVLLFMDIAVIGMLFLVMLGRVVIP